MKPSHIFRLALCTLFSILLSACGDTVVILPFTVSGTVSGLTDGQQVTIVNNGADSLTIGSNTGFTFNRRIALNGSYLVTVATQPNGEICTVTNHAGAGIVANVTNVNVICSTDTFTISGTVSGLTAGNQLELINNGDDPLTVSADGAFTFDMPVASGSGYVVTVANQPRNEICTVSNPVGADVMADVSNVNVICSVDAFTVSGTVTGLNPGQQVTLLNNGDTADPVIATSAHPSFTFGTPVARNGTAIVSIGIQPTQQVCTILNSSHFNVAANIINASVICGITVLHSFNVIDGGAAPQAGLVLAPDGFLYGSTLNGGIQNQGTLFKIGRNPTATTSTYQVVHTFDGTNGSDPQSTLIVGSDGLLYGTTFSGGASNNGTIFKFDRSGVYSVIHSFSGSDGRNPVSELTLGIDGVLYGTTLNGGTSDNGAIFKINPDGTGYTVLHSFDGTNGKNPDGGLTPSNDGFFYGTTVGGAINYGVVYKIDPSDPSSYEVIHIFQGPEGAAPAVRLITINDGFFYGTAFAGGANLVGSVFKISTTGTYTVLHSFNTTDGAMPGASLILGNDGAFYGVTTKGGASQNGAIYKLDSTTNVFTPLFSFSGANGTSPTSALVYGNDGHFYGTTLQGGAHNLGTVFRY